MSTATFFYSILILSFNIIFFADVNTLFALENDVTLQYKKIIREEMIYPRQCRFYIPHKIDISLKSKVKSYLSIGEALQDENYLQIKKENKFITFYPSRNTNDIINAHVNLNYDITHINLILGSYDITVDGIEENLRAEKVYVYGSRIIKDKTRIYDLVINTFSEDKKKEYITVKMMWEITKSSEGMWTVREYVQ